MRSSVFAAPRQMLQKKEHQRPTAQVCLKDRRAPAPHSPLMLMGESIDEGIHSDKFALFWEDRNTALRADGFVDLGILPREVMAQSERAFR